MTKDSENSGSPLELKPLPASLERMRVMGETKAFISREFLNWLWFFSESNPDMFNFEHQGTTLQAMVWVDDRLLLSSAGPDNQQSLMRGGDPSKTEEAAVAMLSGKNVEELKMGAHIEDEGEFTCVLNCMDLSPRSLQLPMPEETEEDENAAQNSPLEVRIHQMRIFLSLVDHLFQQFLKDRLDENWSQTVARDIKEWMGGRKKKNKKTLH